MRLLARGYSKTCLKRAFRWACSKPRHELIYNPESNRNKTNPIRIVTRFSNQNKTVKNIVERYWHVLKLDPTISPFMQDKPSFTFKRAKSIKDNLVSSEYSGGGVGKQDLCKRPKTFRCGGCPYCQFMKTKSNIKLPNGQNYAPKHFANCRTIGVVYLLICDCACYYVGKTSQEFWRWAYRHIASMKSCSSSLPLGRHVSAIHAGIFPKVSFLILDCVHPGIRGGD